VRTEASRRAFRQRPYATKKHDATLLHYDLRLQWNRVLLSWALPKGPSLCAGEVREAIEMEDQRAAYLLFEGQHKTGTIMVWDCGTWEPHPEFDDIERSLRTGILGFTLYGERLKGSWMLERLNTPKSALRPIWTLCKLADSFAAKSGDKCVLEKYPNSLKGKSMAQIVQEWKKPKDKHKRQSKLFDET
jgi:bifunctional non-homologous end joining protein LigD